MVFDPVHPYSHGLMSSILVPEEHARTQADCDSRYAAQPEKTASGLSFCRAVQVRPAWVPLQRHPRKGSRDGRMYRCLLGQDELKEVYSHE